MLVCYGWQVVGASSNVVSSGWLAVGASNNLVFVMTSECTLTSKEECFKFLLVAIQKDACTVSDLQDSCGAFSVVFASDGSRMVATIVLFA